MCFSLVFWRFLRFCFPKSRDWSFHFRFFKWVKILNKLSYGLKIEFRLISRYFNFIFFFLKNMKLLRHWNFFYKLIKRERKITSLRDVMYSRINPPRGSSIDKITLYRKRSERFFYSNVICFIAILSVFFFLLR